MRPSVVHQDCSDPSSFKGEQFGGDQSVSHCNERPCTIVHVFDLMNNVHADESNWAQGQGVLLRYCLCRDHNTRPCALVYRLVTLRPAQIRSLDIWDTRYTPRTSQTCPSSVSLCTHRTGTRHHTCSKRILQPSPSTLSLPPLKTK